MTRTLASRYTLEELIATGGMGEVWRATDSVLERTVALKILRSPGGEKARERFRREALAAAAVSNPAVAHVHDFVDDEDAPAIVMEFVDGETLAEWLHRGRLTPQETIRLGASVCSALQAAHDAGIIHRDIKPGNIMITNDGRVKVTDFGIARAAGDETLTATGQVLGTPHYLAPEQVRGEQAGPAADQYSLGAVLYECLTGRPPFDGDGAAATALARLSREPVPPRMLDSGIPERLNTIVMRSLALAPADRFPSAGAMRAALTNTPPDGAVAAAPVPLTAAPTGPPTDVPPLSELPTARRKRRLPAGSPRRIAVAGAVLGLAIGVTVVAALVAAGHDSPPKCCTVPRLTALAGAPAVLQKAGLKYGGTIERTEPGHGAFELLGLEPAAGMTVPRGTVVRLIINCCVVPRVASMDNAESLLAQAGLKLGTVFYEFVSGDVAAGSVIRLSPAASTLVPRGTKVDIFVAAAQQRRSPGKDKKGGGNGGHD